jgi:hypothetical protein
MADTKISALPASTTPLAGTEVLPIVQSGVTRQVSVANLTAGRAVSATELTLTTGNLIVSNGKGIDFSATPGTGTSELLADYEEGTWTPTVGGTSTYTLQSGLYTKVGRQVTVQCDMVINDIGTGSTTYISGLPFNGASGKFFSGTVSYWSSLNGNYAFVTPMLYETNVQFNTTVLASSAITDTSAVFTSGSRVIFSMTYFV